jgi:hypothetical protein
MQTPFLFLVTALLALVGHIDAAKQSKNSKNAILLSKVKSLTLRADAKTAHRRVSAIPQYVPILFHNSSPATYKAAWASVLAF